MKFRVRAKKRDQPNAKTEEFFREAEKPDDLVGLLQTEGYLVLAVEDTSAVKTGLFGKRVSKKEQKPAPSGKRYSGFVLFESVQGYELSSFFIQLVALLRAGVPILRSLSIVEHGLKKGLLKKVVVATISKISQGYSLSSSFRDYPSVFPSFWLGLIEAGEASGTLPDVLEEIQKYQETSDRFKKKVTSAMVYPAILISFSIGAIAVFMVKVIPTFEKVFQGLGRGKKLPEITQFVLDTSRFMQHNFQNIIIAIVGAVALYQFFIKRPRGKYVIDSVKLKIPLIRSFLLEVAIVRFTRGLATMVRSGIPILQALEIASRLVGNAVIEGKILRAREDVRQGHTLAMPLEKYKVFPIFVTQLISVGEESGNLDKFLDVVSKFYEERVDATIQRISVSIEPIILLLMGGVVGTLVVSMFLPLIAISTGGG